MERAFSKWGQAGVELLRDAGAIIDRLGLPCTAEARIARDAYRSAGHDIAELVRDSVSGGGLIARDFTGDVELAEQRDASDMVPILVDGAYRRWSSGPPA
jgi:2-phosphosulfolactate phosphatase